MSAVWPLIVDRLVALLPTLPGWSGVEVYDGPPVTADAPPTYVTVGFVVGEDFAGNFEPAEQAGDIAMETGVLRSEVVCATGDVDMPAMRARAFGLLEAWRVETVRDPTLGVLKQGSTSSLSVDVAPSQTDRGTVQRLTVTLTYIARV